MELLKCKNGEFYLELTERNTEIEILRSKAEELNEKNSEMESLKCKNNEFCQELIERNTEIETLRSKAEELNEKKSEIESLKCKNDEFCQEWIERNTEIETLRNKIEELAAINAEFESLKCKNDEFCEEMKVKLQCEHEKIENEMKNDLIEVTNNYNLTLNDLDNLYTEFDRLTTLKSELKVENDQLKLNENKELSNLRTNNEILTINITNLEEKLINKDVEYRNQMGKVREQEDIIWKKQEKLNGCENEIKYLNEQMSYLEIKNKELLEEIKLIRLNDFDEDSISSIVMKYNSVIQQHETKEIQYKQELNDLNRQIEEMKRLDMNKMEDYEVKMENMKDKYTKDVVILNDAIKEWESCKEDGLNKIKELEMLIYSLELKEETFRNRICELEQELHEKNKDNLIKCEEYKVEIETLRSTIHNQEISRNLSISELEDQLTKQVDLVNILNKKLKDKEEEYGRRVDKNQDEIEKLENKINDLELNLDDLKSTNQSLNNNIQDVLSTNSGINYILEAKQFELNESEEAVNALKLHNEQLSGELRLKSEKLIDLQSRDQSQREEIMTLIQIKQTYLLEFNIQLDQFRQLKQTITELSDMKNRACVLNFQQIDGIKSNLLSVKRCNQDLVKSLSRKDVEIENIERNLLVLQDKYHFLTGDQKMLSEKNDELNKHNNELIELIPKQDKEIHQLQETLNEFAKNKRVLIEDAVKLKEENSKLQKSLDEVNETNSKLEIINEENRKTCEELEESHRKTKQKIKDYEQKLVDWENRLHRIDEERDDQLFELEKSSNTKIYELQQLLEDKSHQYDLSKDEMYEQRIHSKKCRVELENRIASLQKSLSDKEAWFNGEKMKLTRQLEVERDEKLEYKQSYDEQIVKLNAMMSNDKEQHNLEMEELNLQKNKLQQDYDRIRIENYRNEEKLKKQDTEFNNEKSRLLNRIKELEHQISDVNELKQKLNKADEQLMILNSTDLVKSNDRLNHEFHSLEMKYDKLNKVKQEIAAERVLVEKRLMTTKVELNNISGQNRELKEKLSEKITAIRNLESCMKSLQERSNKSELEIQNLIDEKEVINEKYLRLSESTEYREKYLKKDHSNVVNSYISRIGSNHKEILNYQERITKLTEEKNILSDHNDKLIRNVKELTSKLKGMQEVMKKRSHEDIRNMHDQYDRVYDGIFTKRKKIDNPHSTSFNFEIPDDRRSSVNPFSCEDEPDNCLPMAANLDLEHYYPSSETASIASSFAKKEKLVEFVEPVRVLESNHKKSLNFADKIRKTFDFRHNKKYNIADKMAKDRNSDTLVESKKRKIHDKANNGPTLPTKFNVNDLDNDYKSNDDDILDETSSFKPNILYKESNENYKLKKNRSELNDKVSTSSSDESSVQSLFQKDTSIEHDKTIVDQQDYSPYNSLPPIPPKTPKSNNIVRRMLKRSKNVTKTNKISKHK